ncbi:MAG: YlbF family regulator [Clostridia bacterium]|nr:YlbF family regulator [Clostridia bacterium]
MDSIVIEKAKELALAIASSQEFIVMRATEDAATQDEAMAEAFAKYEEMHQEMEACTAMEQPDFERMAEIDEKMKKLQQEMQALPMALAMQKARKGFTDMMAAVNAELSKVLAPESSCSGDCHSCGGHCHH